MLKFLDIIIINKNINNINNKNNINYNIYINNNNTKQHIYLKIKKNILINIIIYFKMKL